MEEKILKTIEKIQEKQIQLIQEGFVKAKFQIHKANCNIQKDIFIIKDKESENYIKININQIYKAEIKENEIALFLDNDIEIIFQF